MTAEARQFTLPALIQRRYRLQSALAFLSCAPVRRSCALFILITSATVAFAGRSNDGAIDLSRSMLDVSRYEVSVETAYLLGVFGNPHGYEVAPQFVTGRIRW